MTVEGQPVQVDVVDSLAPETAGGSLQITALRKQFGGSVALKGIDLSVNAGEFVSLLGPSGSGKTTTLSIVAGLERPDGGQVILDGVDITSRPSHKRNLGVVFQSYALFPHMTVVENLAYPLRCRRVAAKEIATRVRWALDLVKLDGYDRRYPRELSGGQQQRVAFARAVIYSPRVLLMDEPLSALDRRLRDELQAEIRSLHRDLGTTIIYVTHDQDEALSLSDRIVVMSEGSVQQIGTPEDVYERPVSEFVARFVGTSNFLHGSVAIPPDPNGRTSIRLSSGSIVQAISGDPLKAGTEVKLLVRPEKLHVSRDAAQRGALKVQVADTAYQGHFVLCRGKFETGEPCRLHLSREEAATILGGEECAVLWAANDAIIVNSDQSTATGIR